MDRQISLFGTLKNSAISVAMERSTRVWDPQTVARVMYFVGTSTRYALLLHQSSVHTHTGHGTPIQVLIAQTGYHSGCAGHTVASSLARAAGPPDYYGTPKGTAVKICNRGASSG